MMTEDEARARHATLKFQKRLTHGACLTVILLLSMGLWAVIWSAVAALFS